MKLPTAGGDLSVRLREGVVGLAPATGHILIAAILDALNGKRKASTARGWFWVMGFFLRQARERAGEDICTITLPMFLWATRKWNPSQTKLLRAALRFWSDRKYPGLSADLKHFLLRSRSPKPRSTIEIQAVNPQERPFSMDRIGSILRAVDAAYLAGRFTAQDNLLWKLIVSEALRPAQLAALQVGDVKSLETGNWRCVELSIPWVKQHGKSTRDHIIPTPVSPSVGQALKQQLDFMTALNGGAPLPKNQVLFSVARRNRKPPVLKQKSVRIISLIVKTRKEIAAALDDMDDLDLFSRRFKHTKLTQLALLGAPVSVLARAAFQSTLGTVARYVNLNEEAFADYEARMAPHHSLLARCFQGEISEVPHPYQESHSVLSPDLEQVVGRCSSSPCGVLAPFGCYVCPRFVAFKDGPHEQVLAELQQRKNDAISMGLPRETVERDDNLIAAVSFVVHAVREAA